MKVKLFEYSPLTADGDEGEELLKESKKEFENAVNAFCANIRVSHVVKVREDVIAVWYEEKGKESEPVSPDDPMALARALHSASVNSLELSVRSTIVLNNAGITTVRELKERSEREMLKLRNCGRKSICEIKEKLAALGLSLRP